MNRKLAAWLLLLAPFIAAGCSVPMRSVRLPGIKCTSTIFNPEWTGLPVSSVPRTDWPSTIAYSDFGEEITYRETIIDWQGRFGGTRDQLYYRRFDSIRTGRARR